MNVLSLILSHSLLLKAAEVSLIYMISFINTTHNVAMTIRKVDGVVIPAELVGMRKIVVDGLVVDGLVVSGALAAAGKRKKYDHLTSYIVPF